MKNTKTKSKSKRQLSEAEIVEKKLIASLLIYFEVNGIELPKDFYKYDRNGKKRGVSESYLNLANKVASIPLQCGQGDDEFTVVPPTINWLIHLLRSDDITDNTRISIASVLRWTYYRTNCIVPMQLIRKILQPVIDKHVSDILNGIKQPCLGKDCKPASLNKVRWLSKAPGEGSVDDYWNQTFIYYLPGWVINNYE